MHPAASLPLRNLRSGNFIVTKSQLFRSIHRVGLGLPKRETTRCASPCASVACVFVFVVAASVYADAPVDSVSGIAWPSFQNGGQPVVDDQVAVDSLPRQWSPNENIAWQADIEGYGQSTPIVAHGQVVVTSTSGEKKDAYHVTAYAIETGEKQWQFDVSNPSPFANTPMVSRAAPTGIATDSGFIASFEGGVLVSLSPSGERNWQKDLVQLYGKIEARHGLSASLEQDARRIYVWVERSEQPYVLAIDKTSGEVIWKADGVGKTSWASPRLIPVGDGQHLVCSASGMIIGLDPETGAAVVDVRRNREQQFLYADPCRRRLVLDRCVRWTWRDLIGRCGRVERIDPDQAGRRRFVPSAAFRWSAKKATSTFGSPVVVTDASTGAGKALFVNRAGVLYQLDLKTGEELSADRTDAGGIWATPMVIGDRAYLFGYKGTTSVIDLSDGKQLHENRCWPAPAEESSFGGGKVLYAAAASPPYLLVRRGEKLFAIKSSEQAAKP